MTDMKNIICKLTLGVLVFSAVVACDLDVYPRGSITYNPGDPIITNDEDLASFEANIMSCMRSLTYGVYDYASDIQMDYFNAAIDFGNNVGGIHRSDNSFTASCGEVESYWANMYSAIKNYNVFLEGSIDAWQVVTNTALWKKARGEAYFGRAYAYQCLARHFGNAYNSNTADSDLCVPLVLIYDQNARPARNTVKEVYDQVKADLDSAYYYLADIDGTVRSTRPTVDAVKAMYARYYLDTQNWGNAAYYASDLIESGTYTLCTNNTTSFRNEWIYDSGTEPIVQFYASMSEGSGGHSYYYSVNSMAGNTYTQEYYMPTKEFYDSFDSGDIRRSEWFGTSHPGYSNLTIKSYHNGQYYNETPSNPDYWVFSKYKGNPSYISGNYPNSAQARKLVTIAEMYLIAAEAYYNNGETSTAKTYLNALQSARGATSTNATLDYIKKEWYKETCGQGLRLTCLKRWGDGFDGRTPQDGAKNIVMTGSDYDQKYLVAGAYQFVWPIPSYEMQVNPNLVQNPGYADLDEE